MTIYLKKSDKLMELAECLEKAIQNIDDYPAPVVTDQSILLADMGEYGKELIIHRPNQGRLTLLDKGIY